MGLLLLVGGDLNDRVRVDAAAASLQLTVVAARPEELADDVARRRPDVIVIDLDGAGDSVLPALAALGAEEMPPRVVGYFSHVDEDLGRRARAAGCDAVPRGVFWSSLDDLLQTPDRED